MSKALNTIYCRWCRKAIILHATGEWRQICHRCKAVESSSGTVQKPRPSKLASWQRAEQARA